MHRSAGGQRSRVVASIAAFVLVVGAGLVIAAPAADAATCTLVPELRDVTINQGLGSYRPLVRGKETLVKLFLTMPSCAGRGASIARTGGTLTVTNGAVTLATIAGSTPAPVPTYPILAPASAAPALDAPGDPTFVVPGTKLAPAAPTAGYTATFRATISYSAKASATATPVTGSVTLSTLPGTTTPINAAVEKKTNALRVLVVPMGNPTKGFATQFSDAARAATQKGMQALSRLFPIPSTTTELTGTGGLRYTINPALLDISAVMPNGRFCGTGTTFDVLKGPLLQMLLAWNTANPNAPADRVLGVADAAISSGGSSGCAEGMGTINGPQAWVRAIPDTLTTPSMTGALMAMELGHTLGLVPKARADFYSPYHSPNVQADLTSPNRAYNVSLRSFIADDHTAMALSGAWNNSSVVFERDDYAFLRCALGGAVAGGCAASGTVGTASGVGAEPTFVLSGTTDGTGAGTAVVDSYFATGVPRTAPPATSEYSLVQSGPGGVLRSDRVSVVAAGSEHDEDTHDISTRGLISAAVPFDTSATRIELVHNGAVVYDRDRTAPPVVGATTASPGGTSPGATELVSVNSSGVEGSTSSEDADVSDDGRFVAFESRAVNLSAGDTTTDADIYVRDRQSGTTEQVSVDSGGAQGDATKDALYPSISGDGRYVAFVSDNPALVAGDTNGTWDLFVHDRQSGVTERVNLSTSGAQVTAGVSPDPPAISDDGRYVAFTSTSPDYVAGDTNSDYDVFVRDRVADVTTLVSLNSTGTQFSRGGGPPDFSSDGKQVSFVGLNAGGFDLYVRNLLTSTTEQVSVDSAENDGVGESTAPAVMSGDGRFVVFRSVATNLAPGGLAGRQDVYLRDRQAGTTERVSVDSSGVPFATNSYDATVSDDGRLVAFVSGNSPYTSFLRDRDASTTQTVGINTIFRPVVTGDGQSVTFTSDTAQAPGAAGGRNAVYLRSLASTPASVASVASSATDDNPADNREDLLMDCGAVSYPVAVGLAPATVTATDATFSYNFDPETACAGGTLKAFVSDGFSSATATTGTAVPGDTVDRDPLPTIVAPLPGTTLLAYDAITLQGSAKDPEDGDLGDPALSWSLDGSDVGTGAVVDLSAPDGGWTPGDHSAALSATDTAGHTVSTSVSFTVLGDADHDGVPTSVESGCAGSSDSDPGDAYLDDADGDGIPNADDMTTTGGPCVAATLYQATVDATPDPLKTNSTAAPLQATIVVPFQDVAAIDPASVRILRIESKDVSGNPAFVATSWTVSGGVATATFDRTAVNAFLKSEGIANRQAVFTFGGGVPGTWSFEGADSVAIQPK